MSDYTFRITFGLARKLREAKIVDLLGTDVTKSVTELLFDLEKVGKAIGLLLEARGENVEALVDDMGPEDIRAAQEGLRVAITDFIRSTRPEASETIERTLAKQVELTRRGTSKLVEYLDSGAVDKKFDQLISEALSD